MSLWGFLDVNRILQETHHRSFQMNVKGEKERDCRADGGVGL